MVTTITNPALGMGAAPMAPNVAKTTICNRHEKREAMHSETHQYTMLVLVFALHHVLVLVLASLAGACLLLRCVVFCRLALPCLVLALLLGCGVFSLSCTTDLHVVHGPESVVSRSDG